MRLNTGHGTNSILTRRGRAVAFLIFAVLIAFCLSVATSDAAELRSNFLTRAAITKGFEAEKFSKAGYDETSSNTLALGNHLYSPRFKFNFVRVDRKQNLRLWPVVASDSTRSPPLLRAV
jgi:hypothetical protein